MPVFILTLFLTGVCLAVDPSDRVPLHIPKGATQVEHARISFLLAHKAKSGNLLLEKMTGEGDLCVLRPDQASDLTGAQYTEKTGLKTILVRWSFLEPTDGKALDLVTTHNPIVYRKGDTLYISSSGIDIGDVGTVVESVLIVQLETLPKKIVHKLTRIGW